MPFYELDRDTPARVVLEQTGPSKFRIVVPFRYVDDATGEHYVVPDPRWGDQETDLASVPGILLWFVPRYGHHTLPALLHDQIVHHDLVEERERADRIFRDAMGEQGVGVLRRWLMWAAVSMATMVVGRWWRIVPIAMWLLLFAALAFRLTPPFAAWDVPPFSLLVRVPLEVALVGIILGPPVLAVSWGRRYQAGVMSGYSAVVFAVPITAVVLALGVYVALEWAGTRLLRQPGPAPAPPPTTEIRQRA